MKTLKNKLTHEDEIDLRKVFPCATDAVAELVQDKLQAIQSNKLLNKKVNNEI